MARPGETRTVLMPIAVDTFQAVDSFDRLHLLRDAAGCIGAVRVYPEGEGDGLQPARSGSVPPVRVDQPVAVLEPLARVYRAAAWNGACSSSAASYRPRSADHLRFI